MAPELRRYMCACCLTQWALDGLRWCDECEPDIEKRLRYEHAPHAPLAPSVSPEALSVAEGSGERKGAS